MEYMKEHTPAIIKKFGKTKSDSGSTEVQVAILSHRINHLIHHFKSHPKDNHSRRGLVMMVGKRKRLLKYLMKKNIESYRTIKSTLDIR